MKATRLVVYLTPYVVALNLASAQSPVTLRSMPCGRDQVRVGETKLKVLDKCGEPRLRETVSGANQPNVQQWLYKPNGRMTHMLTFQGMILIRILLLPSRG